MLRLISPMEPNISIVTTILRLAAVSPESFFPIPHILQENSPKFKKSTTNP